IFDVVPNDAGPARDHLPTGFGYVRGLGQPGGPGQQPKQIPVTQSWKKVPGLLSEKFAGKLDPFAPLIEERGGPEGKGPSTAPGCTNRPAQPFLITDVGLVRFFDAGVQPGRVYEYSIQVLMANP